MERAVRSALQRLRESELEWQPIKGSAEKIRLIDDRAKKLLPVLAKAAERRLDDLAANKKRSPEDDEKIYSELMITWTAEDTEPNKVNEDSATVSKKIDAVTQTSRWFLERIEAVEFGGLNGPGATEPFIVELSPRSTCFLGGNGTGKTSLISAIAWALTGQRISDATGLNDTVNERHPIYAHADPNKQIGNWPPVATYPIEPLNHKDPVTSVALTFRRDGTEERATVKRTWRDNVQGRTVEFWDAALDGLHECIDIAVEMPLRISHLRLGERGRLDDAVASLTGLDLLTSVGEFVTYIARGNSTFLNTPKQSDHSARRQSIDRLFLSAETRVSSLSNEIAALKKLEEWSDRAEEYDTTLRAAAERLDKRAGEDLSTLRSYVDPLLNLDNPEVQSAVENAVAAAATTYDPQSLGELAQRACPKLSAFRQCAENVEAVASRLADVADFASAELEKVIELHRRRLLDRKLVLKAVAAETHNRLHGNVDIETCPLCDREFDTESLRLLGGEIKGLIADAELMRENLATSCSNIISDLDAALFKTLGMSTLNLTRLEPVEALGDELRRHFVTSQVFSKTLPSFGKVFETAFTEARASSIPAFDDQARFAECSSADLPPEDLSEVSAANEAIAAARRAASMVRWCPAAVRAIDAFCAAMLRRPSEHEPASNRTFGDLCAFLSRATKQAKPALLAAQELRKAADEGATWLKNEKTRRIRADIAKAIDPLKLLPKYVEVEVGRQLSELSGRISAIVEKFDLSAGLAFRGARIDRDAYQRKGTLRARASPRKGFRKSGKDEGQFGYEVDATLIANASWLRALLWAFLFALRERRSQQLNGLALPLLLTDDPQLTFDVEHRCSWIRFVLDPQADDALVPSTQSVFSTYDKSFAHDLDLLVHDFSIRHIFGPPAEGESIFIDGTELVDRVWMEAEELKTNEAVSSAIGELRKHLESMLHAVFPSAMGAEATTLGKLMDEFRRRIRTKASFPYETSEFVSLVDAWAEPSKEKYRKALSEPHHNEQSPYNYEFGRELFKWFRKGLYDQFHAAFVRIWRVREAGWKMPHGGMAAISAVRAGVLAGAAILLPANLNKVVARVAAESEGREVIIIEGQPSLHFVEEEEETGDLGEVEAVLLAAATLEPAAQIGDVLLVTSKLNPTPNSLVVCETDGSWRARRFSPLGASAVHAILTANAVNPREIRQPILVENRHEFFRKVVGIVYRNGWNVPSASENETAPMDNIGLVHALLSRSEGRARVVGQSAEPIALEGQYLMLARPVKSRKELEAHNNQPVVVDRNGRILFKRLRLSTERAPIVLESLDAAGRYPPVVITIQEAQQLGQELKVRPVLGVLFDGQRLPKLQS